MKKLLVPFLFCILLLASCITMDGGQALSTGENVTGREKAAIMLLGSDMAEALGRDSIDYQAMEGLLPEGYLLYRSYAPSFDALEKAYLSGVEAIVKETIQLFRPAVRAAVTELAEDADQFIPGDDTLSKAIWNRIESFVPKTVSEELLLHKAELDALYTLSGRTFNEIRKAYGNLSAVGLEYALPEPEPLSMAELAKFTEEELYRELLWNEKLLKNTPAQAGTLYTVFWEN